MTLQEKSAGVQRRRLAFIALAIDMPQVTDVIAKNRIIAMIAMDIEMVLIFAAS